MANIREESAPAGLGLNPSETGIEAVAGDARRVGMFYNQTADLRGQEGGELKGAVMDAGQVANDYLTHRDISAGAANGAQLVANVNDLWNQQLKTADPNDPAAAAKFREETLEPTLEQFKSGFTTEQSQQWAEHFVDQYRQHMFEKTSADMSTLAGIAVRKNVATTVNSLSSAVASDPSSLDFALSSVDHSIGAMVDSSPNIDATTGAAVKSEIGLKAKESIVKSAISGMITKNPNVDLDAIQKKYGEYLDGAEMKMFQAAAVRQAKSDASAARADLLNQKTLADMQVHQDANKAVIDNVTIDPQTNRPVIKPQFFNQSLDIVKKNPTAPNAAATFRTLTEWGNAQETKGERPVDDPVVKSDLMTRMFSADKPTTTLDLMKAHADGKISDHSFEAMHGLVQELEQSPLKGPVWHDTIEAVKSELVLSGVGLPGKDIAGEGNYAKWAQTFIPQYLAKSRAGTLEPNALDPNDPNSFLSKSMAPFKRSVSQRAQDYLSVLSGGGAPSGPAERNDAMPAIPPANQRPAGAVYETPRGKMKWTGTGWVAP